MTFYDPVLRRLTSSIATGTPRVTFTRTTASNGFKSPGFETPSLCSRSCNDDGLQIYSTAACVPIVVVPARIITDCDGFPSRTRATTEYSSPDTVVRGATSGTHVTTNYAYNAYTGQIASVTDPNGQLTSFAYDPMLRQTTLTRPDSAQIVQTYNDSLNTVSNTQPIQGTAVITRTDYLDGLGRSSQTSTFDASNKLYSTTQTQYDGLGRPYNISNPFRTTAPSPLAR